MNSQAASSGHQPDPYSSNRHMNPDKGGKPMSSQVRTSLAARTWKRKIGLLALAAGGILAIVALSVPAVLRAATAEPSAPRAPSAPTAGSAIVSWEYDQIRPEAAYGSSASQYLVVWEDHHWGWGDDWDIYGQRVNASGALVGSIFGISWDDSKHRLAPDVAYNAADDEFLVVWEYAYSETDHDILDRLKVVVDPTAEPADLDEALTKFLLKCIQHDAPLTPAAALSISTTGEVGA